MFIKHYITLTCLYVYIRNCIHCISQKRYAYAYMHMHIAYREKDMHIHIAYLEISMC